MKNGISTLAVGLAFGASGAAALIYEVAWTRVLSLVLGSTVFAVSIMLATFMAGLALGGWIGGRLSDRSGLDPIETFGYVEAGIGASGLLSVFLIVSVVPRLYHAAYMQFSATPLMYYSSLVLLCALVMLVPTTLMGVTFPLVSRFMVETSGSIGRSIGNAYFFNTSGAILGSLAAGFVLIPQAGTKWTVFSASVLNCLVAIAMLMLSGRRKAAYALPAVIVLIAGGMLGVDMQLRMISPTVASRYKSYNEFLSQSSRETVLFEKEDIEGRVRLFRAYDGAVALKVGSRIEGSTSLFDRAGAVLPAHLPAAAHPDPRRMLVIGLGFGTTVKAARDDVPEVDVVEINKAVVEAIRGFGQPGVLNGVGVIIDDARHYVSVTDKKYDIITSTPSYPSTQGVSNLYTREFYEKVSLRLEEGGIFCQWMPYYYMSDDDVTMMLKTMGSVFGHVTLWKIPETMDLFMLASSAPMSRTPDEIAMRILKYHDRDFPYTITLSRGEDDIRHIVRWREKTPLNTDDRPLLEYSVAINRITRFEK